MHADGNNAWNSDPLTYVVHDGQVCCEDHNRSAGNQFREFFLDFVPLVSQRKNSQEVSNQLTRNYCILEQLEGFNLISDMIFELVLCICKKFGWLEILQDNCRIIIKERVNSATCRVIRRQVMAPNT